MTKVTVQPGVHAVVGAEQQVDGGDGQQQGGLDDGVVADGGGDERVPGEDDQPKVGVAGRKARNRPAKTKAWRGLLSMRRKKTTAARPMTTSTTMARPAK